jgi:sarcosine oxidase
MINCDVLVVGGGVMGAATAWHLADRGVAVVLLERFQPRHAYGASHGASRIFRFAYPDPYYVAMARAALPLWREVEQRSGRRLLVITGGVDHGPSADLDDIAAALESVGVPGEWLTPHEAELRWPGLRFEHRVLFHPAGGRLHADDAVSAMVQLASEAGAVVRYGVRAEELVRTASGMDVHASDEAYRARRVVVTAGAWTEQLLGQLLSLPTLQVTQEQPAAFPARTESTPWPSFIHHRDPAYAPYEFVYGLQSPGEGVKVGFHRAGEPCHPDRRSFLPEPGQLAALQDYVREWAPGVAADQPVPISCTYTSTQSQDFVLDADGPLTVGAGFSGHGYKFAPLIGQMLADLAMGKSAPVRRFALRR